MDKLLYNLKHETYCRICVSKIHGVGVIAIKDIPKGVDPFKLPIFNRNKPIKINKGDYNKLDSSVKKLVADFIAKEDDGSFYVPKYGMNSLDISFYMNHSDDNNIDHNDNHDNFMTHLTNRKIKKGEELTINYADFKD